MESLFLQTIFFSIHMLFRTMLFKEHVLLRIFLKHVFSEWPFQNLIQFDPNWSKLILLTKKCKFATFLIKVLNQTTKKLLGLREQSSQSKINYPHCSKIGKGKIITGGFWINGFYMILTSEAWFNPNILRRSTCYSVCNSYFNSLSRNINIFFLLCTWCLIIFWFLP